MAGLKTRNREIEGDAMASETRNRELLKLAKDGDAAARDRLIVENQDIAKSRVSAAAAADEAIDRRAIRDDLFSSAMVSVVEATDELIAKQVDADFVVSGYLAYAADAGIMKTKAEAPAVGPGKSTVFAVSSWKEKAYGEGRSKRNRRAMALYSRIASGDVWAAEQLYQETFRLLRGIVNRYTRQNPGSGGFSNALLRIADFHLAKAVHSLTKPHSYKRSPLAHIFAKIKRAMASASIKPWDADCFVDFVFSPIEESSAAVAPDESLIELWDSIERCCRDDIDRKIVTLRLYGRRDGEIATDLGMSRPTVCRARQAIEARFDQQEAAIGA